MLKKMLRELRRGRDPKPAPLPLVLYTRTGCHLCEEAKEMLREYVARSDVTLQEIDIDSRPELIAAYGDKVPVIALDNHPRLWGKINEIILRRLIRAERTPGANATRLALDQTEKPR